MSEYTECAVCGHRPDPERVPPETVLSLADIDETTEIVTAYPFNGSLSVPFACSDECWIDVRDDGELVVELEGEPV